MPPDASRRKLLLVGWDSADWGLITPWLDRGALPALRALVERGTMGPLTGDAAPSSALAWTSLATGKRADKHGVLLDHELDAETGILQPTSRRSLRAACIWDILDRSGVRSHAVNWPASHPAPRSSRPAGVRVTDGFWSDVPPADGPWPLRAAAVEPKRLVETLADLRTHPADIGLESVVPFAPDLRAHPDELGRLAGALAAIIAEAASVQAAATWLMEHEPWRFVAVRFPGLRRLAQLVPSDAGQPQSAQAILVNGYRFHDMMLARLVELAGADATVMVVSERGSQPARSRGILCVAGPGIREDELLHQATILDVAPTILSLFGLPVGADMDGWPLGAIWDAPSDATTVPTWETEAADDNTLREDADPDLDAALAALHDQGYVAPSPAGLHHLEAQLQRQADGHVAIVHLQAGRPAEAADVLRGLLNEAPANTVVRLYLAFACAAAGDVAESRRHLEAVAEDDPLAKERTLLQSMLLLADNKTYEALELLRAAGESSTNEPVVLHMWGSAWLRAGELSKAEEAFRRAVTLDETCVDAQFGLALTHVRQRDWEAAADRLLTVVALQHHRASAHYLLGVALFHLNLESRAIRAFESALALAPHWTHAQRWVTQLRSGTIRPPLEERYVGRRLQH